MRGMRFLTGVALVALAGCSSADGAPPATRSAQTPSATSTEAATTATATSTEAATTATATGEPFSLLTHCGIARTQFAGRDWVAVTPLAEPRIRDDVTGVVVSDGYTTGTMTVVDDDLVRFTVTDPTVEEVGLTVDFVPAAAPPTSFCE